MIPAFGLRSSVAPELPAGPLRGQCAVSGSAASVAGERYPSQVGPEVKPRPHEDQPPHALRHSGHGLRA